MTAFQSQAQPVANPLPAASGPQNVKPEVDPTTRRREMASRPITQRTIVTICVALAITFAFDRLVCDITPTWLSGYAVPLFWVICTTALTALHWRTARKRPLVWLVSGSIIAIGIWEVLFSSVWSTIWNTH